jgi:hypothetical protein
MGIDKKEMIQQLKFEIEMIEKAGYYPSVREPRRAPEIFRDSITCLNVGLEEKEHECSSCFLSEFAPPEVRNSSGDICHKILLNEKGDTVESLKAEGDPYKLQTAVLSWLKKTVAKLEQEIAASK